MTGRGGGAGGTEWGAPGADLPSGTAAAYLVLAVPGAPFPCGACAVSIPLVLLPAQVAGSQATLPLGLPCDPALVGGIFELQWWAIGPAVNLCPIVRSFTFSDRLHATVGG